MFVDTAVTPVLLLFVAGLVVCVLAFGVYAVLSCFKEFD